MAPGVFLVLPVSLLTTPFGLLGLRREEQWELVGFGKPLVEPLVHLLLIQLFQDIPPVVVVLQQLSDQSWLPDWHRSGPLWFVARTDTSAVSPERRRRLATLEPRSGNPPFVDRSTPIAMEEAAAVPTFSIAADRSCLP